MNLVFKSFHRGEHTCFGTHGGYSVSCVINSMAGRVLVNLHVPDGNRAFELPVPCTSFRSEFKSLLAAKRYAQKTLDAHFLALGVH